MIKNSLLSIFASLINALLLFYVIPKIMIQSEGEIYGILASCLIILNLIPFLSLSVFYSLSKVLSSGDSKYKYIVNSFLVIICTIILCDVIFIIFDDVFIKLLLDGKKDFINFYYFTIYIFSILMLSEVVRGIFAAYEKNYLYEILRILYSIFFWVPLIWLNKNTSDKICLYVSVLIFVWFVMTIVIMQNIINRDKDKYIFRMNLILEQYRPGVKLTIANVFVVFFQPVTKILISNLIGVTYVGYFDFALRIQQQIHSLAQKGLFPLYTFFCKNRKDLDKNIMTSANMEMAILLMTPFLLLIMLNIKDILVNFYSYHFISQVYVMMICLVIVSFMWGTSVIPMYFNLMADVKYKSIYMYHFVILIVNIALFIILYQIQLDNILIILVSYSLSMFSGYVYIVTCYKYPVGNIYPLIITRLCIPLVVFFVSSVKESYLLYFVTVLLLFIGIITYVKEFNSCKRINI
ncbi:TPA: hypothetical protein ACX6PW_003769 [Photobacterium damselae]